MEEPTNADLQRAFEEHAKHDALFQDETRESDKVILGFLQSIHKKMEGFQTQLDKQGEKIDNIEKKIDPILEIYDGFVFGRKAVIWTAGGVGGLTVIAGAIMAIIKILKS